MTCMHGYRLTDCLTCHKEAHECDYGSCRRRFTQMVRGRRSCQRHIIWIEQTTPALPADHRWATV